MHEGLAIWVAAILNWSIVQFLDDKMVEQGTVPWEEEWRCCAYKSCRCAYHLMGESWSMPFRISLHNLSPFFWRRSCRWVRRCKDLPDTEWIPKSSYKLFLQLRLSTKALHPVTSANCGRTQLLLIPCAGPQQCSFKTERAGSCT